MYGIIQIILGVIVFVLASGLLILFALFYDHRNKPGLALKYVLGFICFVGVGVLLVFSYHIYIIVLVPIFIWGYFFFMFLESKSRNKKLDNKDPFD